MKIFSKCLIIPLFVFLPSSNKLTTGTILAVVYTPDKIYMFSDGRVIEADTKIIISDNESKVFMLTKRCAILTGGIKMLGLEDSLSAFFKINHIVYVNQAIPYIHKLVLTYSNQPLIKSTLPNHHKIFLFVCGYDDVGKQRLYYLDSNSPEPFVIQEHTLLYYMVPPQGDIDIGCMANSKHESGQIIADEIKRSLTKPDFKKMLDYYIRHAFDCEKDSLSKYEFGVGGKTYEYVMTKDSFYSAN